MISFIRELLSSYTNTRDTLTVNAAECLFNIQGSKIIAQQLAEHLLPVHHEGAGDRVMLCVLQRNRRDALSLQQENIRTRIGHQDWGVGGDDELGILLRQLMHPRQQ